MKNCFKILAYKTKDVLVKKSAEDSDKGVLYKVEFVIPHSLGNEITLGFCFANEEQMDQVFEQTNAANSLDFLNQSLQELGLERIN